MGTITGIGDLDPTRWPRSKWRNLEVFVNMCPSSIDFKRSFSNDNNAFNYLLDKHTLLWC